MMKKLIAGMSLMFVILLSMFIPSGMVYAYSADETVAAYEKTEDSAEGSTDAEDAEEDSEEDAQVLGEKRDQTDKFVLGIEIAISLTFAVGLIAASRGADIK